MNIKGLLSRFDQKTYIFGEGGCVCSLSPSIINYAYPNFRTTCTCAMTLQHEFELSTLPLIPSNGHVGGLHIY